MIGPVLRSPRSGNLTLASIIFIIFFIALVYNHLGTGDYVPSRPARGSTSVSFQSARGSERQLIDLYFDHLQRPSVRVDAPTYRPWGAFGWRQAKRVFWSQPMGNKMCIIDLDDRKFNESGQIFGPEIMTWDKKNRVHGLSLGILNHWLYAKIHGYRYYYVQTETPSDRRSSWKKPAIISRILKQHEACVYMDSDATFAKLDLPFEWLMNYWELSPISNSLALAVDPDKDYNRDEKGKLNLNTGFIVAQNNDKTHEIMDAWHRCPESGGKYPGCEKYLFNQPGRPTDQAGFGSFVRYEYKADIKELSCEQANGYPEAHTGCDGIFIHHLWSGKGDFIKIAVGEQIPGPYLELFHREFLSTLKSFYTTEAQLMGS